MTEKYKYNQPLSYNRRERLEMAKNSSSFKKSLGVVALGVSLLAVGAFGGPKLVKSAKNLIHPPTEHIDSETFKVDAGENVVNDVEDAVDNMVSRDNIDPSQIRHDQIVYESQEAAFKSMQDRSQNFILPGDEFKVELTKSGSDYTVSVDPADPTNLDK